MKKIPTETEIVHKCIISGGTIVEKDVEVDLYPIKAIVKDTGEWKSFKTVGNGKFTVYQAFNGREYYSDELDFGSVGSSYSGRW